MDQELVQYLDQRFEEMRREIRERSEETKRHTGVLAEDLRYQVRLVAEGFTIFVDGRYAQDQANIDRRFDETNALIRSLYAQINQRFENIERKSQR